MTAALHIHSNLRYKAVAAIAVLGLVACSAHPSIDRPSTQGSDANATPNRAASSAWVRDAYAKLQLSFEANVGQTDPQVDFLARGSGYTLFLTQGDAVLALRGVRRSPAHAPERLADGHATDMRPVTVGVLRMHLLGGNPAARAAPEQPLSGAVNYFIGNDPSKWRVGVPTYARITYPEVYPGIDLVYYGNEGRLEYDFVVAPGADPSAIAFGYDGALDLELDSRGDLVLRLGGQEVRQARPLVYQMVGGERREVDGSYVRHEAGTIGFTVGAFDRTRPLVIDPTLVYSTYLGGTGFEEGIGIAVDSMGSAYVAGVTTSATFPTTGAFDTTFNGGPNDAFVTKLNPTGSALVYSTYLGGSGFEGGAGVTVDASFNAYVTGFTESANFPTTAGAFDTTFNGGDDVFVTKLDPTGSALVYSTYLGGSGSEEGFGIAVDSGGNAYVTGVTTSTDFPTTAGAFDTTFDGVNDAFVTKLSPAGSAPLVYSTYLGGSDYDSGRGIALDSGGNAYVAGLTLSTDFPTTAGAFDTSFNGGGSDAFVTRLNATGTAPLAYSTYLGGSDFDEGFGIAVGSAGNAYVTGFTLSTDFPTTAGAFDTTFNGGSEDAFVTKLNPAGGAPLVYSTYLGGSVNDQGRSIAVDSAGSSYVTGLTSSANFPTTTGAFDTTLSGVFDAFVTKLSPTGTALLYSTYLGGSFVEHGLGIAVDSAGNAYVTGFTTSTDFPTTAGAFDTTFNGGEDAFVTKLKPPIGPPATLTLEPVAAINSVGDTHCVTATVRDASGNPTPNVTVRFTVVGAQATFASPASGMDTTDAAGEARFCFTAELPGDNAIHAFADTDNDTTQDPGEPSNEANKTWTVPPSAALCEVKVTEGGQITALNGDRANFGGVAKSEAGSLSGNENYQDQGPLQPLHMKSTQITAVTCAPDRMTAQVFGDATIDGSGSFKFRIRVTDNGEPGRNDIYGIILSNGYASGDRTLEGGNVQIH